MKSIFFDILDDIREVYDEKLNTKEKVIGQLQQRNECLEEWLKQVGGVECDDEKEGEEIDCTGVIKKKKEKENRRQGSGVDSEETGNGDGELNVKDDADSDVGEATEDDEPNVDSMRSFNDAGTCMETTCYYRRPFTNPFFG